MVQNGDAEDPVGNADVRPDGNALTGWEDVVYDGEVDDTAEFTTSTLLKRRRKFL